MEEEEGTYVVLSFVGLPVQPMSSVPCDLCVKS
jgi:hypothetical protein